MSQIWEIVAILHPSLKEQVSVYEAEHTGEYIRGGGGVLAIAHQVVLY